jgi:hypothetical protein
VILESIVKITQTSTWRDIYAIATNRDLTAIGSALTACLAFAATVGRGVLYVRKRVAEIRAARVASEIFERTRVSSFSKNDIKEAMSEYVWPDASSIDPSDEDDLRNVPVQGSLLDAIQKLTKDERERLHLILLADSGMGKTTFCINFYAKFRKVRKMAIVPLGRSDAVDVIKSISSPHDTMLFLDAFDEDAGAVRDKEGRFAELMETAKGFQHVIVTCRSQFFLHDDEIPFGSRIMRLGPRRAGEVREYPMRRLYLAPFSERQINQYIRSHFPWHRWSSPGARSRARDMIRSIPELSVRPMLLALVPDLVKDRTTLTEIFDLYAYMVGKWLERESDWIERDTLLAISKSLAVRLYVQQQAGGIDRLTPDELAAVADAFGNDTHSWQLTSRSLLNRDINGYYKFAHRSILEYLFVSAALDGMDQCFTVPWTDMMAQLLISRNVATNGLDETVASICGRDLSATRLLPLFKRESFPARLSRSELIEIVRSGGLDEAAVRINDQWFIDSYRVSEDEGITTLTDLVRGVTWSFFSAVPAGDDPKIYMEPLSGAAREVARELGLLNRQGTASAIEFKPASMGRLPSTFEMLWLLKYLRASRELYGTKFPGSWLLNEGFKFWLGDAVEGNSYLLCTFNEGDLPRDLVRVAGESSGGGGFAVYEVQQRPGAQWNAGLSAFTARIPRGLSDWARIGMLGAEVSTD